MKRMALSTALFGVLVTGVGFAGLVDGRSTLSVLTLSLGVGLSLLAARALVAIAKPSKAAPLRLWELEDIYSTLSIQIASHRERREEAFAEGRRSFSDGEISDRELAYLENTYDDLRYMSRQLVALHLRTGGEPARLRELDARLEQMEKSFELESAL